MDGWTCVCLIGLAVASFTSKVAHGMDIWMRPNGIGWLACQPKWDVYIYIRIHHFHLECRANDANGMLTYYSLFKLIANCTNGQCVWNSVECGGVLYGLQLNRFCGQTSRNRAVLHFCGWGNFASWIYSSKYILICIEWWVLYGTVCSLCALFN